MGLLMNEFTTALLFSRGCEDDDTTTVIFPVAFTAPSNRRLSPNTLINLASKSLSVEGYIVLLFICLPEV